MLRVAVEDETNQQRKEYAGVHSASKSTHPESIREWSRRVRQAGTMQSGLRGMSSLRNTLKQPARSGVSRMATTTRIEWKTCKESWTDAASFRMDSRHTPRVCNVKPRLDTYPIWSAEPRHGEQRLCGGAPALGYRSKESASLRILLCCR
jgi:hypothetical protein